MMRRFLSSVAVLALLCAAALAAEVTYSGYLVDNYCWDQPGHEAIDGAMLETRPQDHEVHCLLFSPCKNSGYVLLEQDTATMMYSVKYRLDATGNANAIALLEASTKEDDYYVTATGDDQGNGTLHDATLVEAQSGNTDGAAALHAPLALVAVLATALVCLA